MFPSIELEFMRLLISQVVSVARVNAQDADESRMLDSRLKPVSVRNRRYCKDGPRGETRIDNWSIQTILRRVS